MRKKTPQAHPDVARLYLEWIQDAEGPRRLHCLGCDQPLNRCRCFTSVDARQRCHDRIEAVLKKMKALEVDMKKLREEALTKNGSKRHRNGRAPSD